MKIKRGDTHMTSTLTEWGLGWGEGGGIGVSEYSGSAIFIFFLFKKIGFAPWPDIILNQKLIYHWHEIFLLTLPSDSEAIL